MWGAEAKGLGLGAEAKGPGGAEARGSGEQGQGLRGAEARGSGEQRPGAQGSREREESRAGQAVKDKGQWSLDTARPSGALSW